jgi:ribosomal protein L11 methyltransferase
MPWLQLELEANPANAEHLSELLQAAGAGAVTLQDMADEPLFEPPPGATPLWNSTRVTGLFAADTDIPAILASLEQQLEPAPLPPWHLNPLEDRDWIRAWMDNFQPMQFGKQLWICPSGFTPPVPEAINIQLDPGLAFGTGTHPTTAMCLRWLDAHPPRDMRVIDYGCGSGILGIAACKLGARQVIAVDTDPQALLATQANAEKNHVADCIQAYLPADFLPEPVPLLLANILAGPLHSLAPHFAELVTPGGQLVLSGILTEQAEELRHQYQAAFDIKLVAQQEEWVCLAGQRR